MKVKINNTTNLHNSALCNELWSQWFTILEKYYNYRASEQCSSFSYLIKILDHKNCDCWDDFPESNASYLVLRVAKVSY